MRPWLLLPLLVLPSCRGGGHDSAPASQVDTDTDTAPAPDSETDSDSDTDTGESLLQFTGDGPENLLVISIDTLRRDRIGFFGGGDDTPWLDARLAESFVLDELRSCTNWTYASVICLFAGQSTVDLGFEAVTDDPAVPSPPPQLDMMPLWLQQAGFRTVAVSGSPYISDEAGVITSEGFDTLVYDSMGSSLDFPAAEWAVDQALEQATTLVADDTSPWFLQVHLMDPHTPFKGTAEYLTDLEGLDPLGFDVQDPQGLGDLQVAYPKMTSEEQALARAHIEVHYGADLKYMDDQLTRLWTGLDDLGALDDTLVLFWSDHGEQFWDHAQFGHSQSLYQEENRALGAFWAQDIEVGRSSVSANHQDLVPTIFPVLGVPRVASWTGSPLQGIADDHIRTAFRYTAGDPGRFMATGGDHVLIYATNGRKFFYDTAADGAELVDLYDRSDPTLISLWEALSAEIDRVEAFIPHLDPKDEGP